jgi:phosphoribosylformylglycinamidine synthase
MNTPNGGSKRWIYEQYDRTIQGNSVETCPGNAAIIRLPHSLKGLALTTDVTPRYCAADPFEGAKHAVAEAFRNITAIGATPKAVTDCLNFGNPENEHVMGQLIASIEGLREACLVLELPIISGNVSLYNETAHRPILPTPTVGCVGLLEDVSKHATPGFKKPGELIFLIGHTQGWLGQSIYARDILDHVVGAPPPVDLTAERLHASFIREQIQHGHLTTVHDCSDGGLLVTLAEMALESFAEHQPCGFTFQPEFWAADFLSLPRHAFLFGEDQARYMITIDPSHADALMSAAQCAHISCVRLGVTGGIHIAIPDEEPLLLTELRDLYNRPLLHRLSEH